MFRNSLLAGAASVLVASAAPAIAQGQDLAAPEYPETRAGDVVDTQFGVDVADPYRWLENDVRVDEEVADWVERQNAVTNAFLAQLPGREALKERITQLTDYERFGLPTSKGGHYFYTRNNGLQNQSVLYVRDGLDGEPRELIDPNEWADDGATALADYAITDDGSKLLYAIQDGGSDWRTVKVMDVATGAVLEDTVEWVKFSNLDWAKDGSGFYYSRFPATGEGETFQALNTNQQVYFHKLGTQQGKDRLIYETPEQPELNHTAQVSDDGRWLVVTSSSGTDERYAINLIDLERPEAEPLLLVPGFDHDYTFVGNLGQKFFFTTNDGAPLMKVVSIDIAAGRLDDRHSRTRGDAGRRLAGRSQADRQLPCRCQEQDRGVRARRYASGRGRAARHRQRRRLRRRSGRDRNLLRLLQLQPAHDRLSLRCRQRREHRVGAARSGVRSGQFRGGTEVLHLEGWHACADVPGAQPRGCGKR